MLVWKTQTLNVNVASLRYRALLPLRYLQRLGLRSVIYSGADPVALSPEATAIIFVKSFLAEDVATCEQAYQLGVPIILDLCDNIFIEEYATDSRYVPAQNFRVMAARAATIVTTGEALKAAVERYLASFGLEVPVVVIPDGNETLADIQAAFDSTRQQRLSRGMWQLLKKLQWPAKALRRSYGRPKRLMSPVKQLLKRSHRKASQLLNLEKPMETVTGAVADTGCETTDCETVDESLAVSQPVSSNQHKKKQVQPTPLIAKAWPPAAPGVKTVLWFGNHGAKYGNFGMLNILSVAPALAAIAQTQPLRLMVVSNSREKYDEHIAPLPFATDYLPWHPRKIYDYIGASDVVIVPNSQSVYSICKSANRAVLALSQGVPVVASSTPALAPFAGCVWLDDWEIGLRAYLGQSAVGRSHIARAQAVIAECYSGEAIAQSWLTLLSELSAQANRPATTLRSR
jgi:hypothetical protein